MRMVAGAALMTQGITILWGGPQIEAFLLNLLATGAGLLLLAGLWTPIAGAMVAFLELWKALSQPVDPWTHILLGTVGIYRTWRLVGRRSPFWMEAHRYSNSKELAFTLLRVCLPTKKSTQETQYIVSAHGSIWGIA
jgi:hypothetical protein